MRRPSAQLGAHFLAPAPVVPLNPRALPIFRPLPTRIGAHAAYRARRVAVLVACFATLGLADLAITLAFMSGVGLFEGNPLARAIATTGGAKSLAAFKALTLLLSGFILLRLRAHRAAEIAAWMCVLAMLFVSWEWTRYAAHAEEIAAAAMLSEITYGAPGFHHAPDFVRVVRN